MLTLLTLFIKFSAPEAHAQMQCFELFNIYKTVQGDKEFLVKLGHKFSYEDKTYGFKFVAVLENDGTLFLDTELVNPRLGIRSHMHGGNLYAQMMQHFGAQKITGIRDIWSGGTNFSQFHRNLRNRMSIEDAAYNTWSGRQAARYGFTKLASYEFITAQESEFGDIPYPIHRRPFELLFTRP
jgi:hypothetical protein